jgi:S-adenosylmethionine-diacylglycerol 3-amino-3-carboxypropyl transferase
MNSEFLQVELNQLRYSLVWEDSDTLFSALHICSADNVLIITSAGCNVLNALLKNPAKVVAIDINSFQNKLLLLKKHIILHHEYFIYTSLLGLYGVQNVNLALQQLLPTLQATDKTFWSNFFLAHPAGILTAGKLEKYITAFYKTLSSEIQQRLKELIRFETVGEQYEYFIQHLDNSMFKEMFIDYFDDENLSKGRDPKLLKYATESGGVTFYNRLKKHISTFTLKDNFYFRLFFF